MIREQDILALPPGVTLEGGRLCDTVRAASWPLNASGSFVLGRAGEPLGRTVVDLAEAAGLPHEQARHDVLHFVWQLNALALVNVDRRGSRLRQIHAWVVLAARLAPAGALPGVLARRRPLDTRTPVRGLLTGLRASLARGALLALIAVTAAVQLAALAGTAGVVAPAVAALGLGAGVALHEAAHAALLTGVPSALVTHGRRTYVLHASLDPRRRAAVALAGPTAPALIGVLLVAVGSAVTLPVLAAFGWPLAAHAVSLTVASGDGRTTCGL